MNTTNGFGVQVKASDVRVGHELVCGEDGYLMTVRSVERKGSMVVLTLGSDFSPCRTTRQGMTAKVSHRSVFVRAKTAEEHAAEGRY